MSVPPNTLWYNGDWNLFVGITPDPISECPCDTIMDAVKQEECSSRPPNELNDPNVLMATYSDFDVTDALGWTVVGMFSNDFTTLPLSLLQTFQATYEIRQGVSTGNPGTLIASGTAPLTVTPTGRTSGIYTEYQFLINGLSIGLNFGKYYMNVAPIIPPEVIADQGSQFLIYNSTTDGANAIGQPPGNNGNDYVVVGTPMPSVFVLSTTFGPQFHDFSNGVFGFVNPICIDPDMEVTLQDGTQVAIKDLKEGALLRTTNPRKPAKLVINYRNEIAHRVMVHISPDSIEEGVPSRPLIITTNHPIIVAGEWKKPRSLINGDTIVRRSHEVPINTHTLVTDNGKPVMINGVPVSTWNINKWNRK